MISEAAAPIQSNHGMAQARLPIAVHTSASARLAEHQPGNLGKRMILPKDVSDDDDRGEGAAPIERRRPPRLAGDEGERQAEP